MEITIKKEISTKVDVVINVPGYYDHGFAFYKILDSENFIEIYRESDENGIAVKCQPSIVAIVVSGGTEISKEEFDAAFSEALNKLTNLPSIEAVTNQR